MTLPACIVDDDVRCKYNKTKFGVVVEILPKTNSREKTYFVKWETSGISVPVQRKLFIKQHNPEKYNNSIIELEELSAKQRKFRQGGAILPVTKLKSIPTFQYLTPPAAILHSVEYKTKEVRLKIEVERHRTENEVPPTEIQSHQIKNEVPPVKVQTHQTKNEEPPVKVCDEDFAVNIKPEPENYYITANIANAIVRAYKQFNCPVYSDYSRGHCYEIV